MPTEYNHKSRLKPLSDVPSFRTVKVGICKLSFPARIDLISWFCVSHPGHTLDGLLCWVPWRTLSVMSAGHHPVRQPRPLRRPQLSARVSVSKASNALLWAVHQPLWGQPEPWAAFRGPSSGVDAGAAVGPSRPAQLRGERGLSGVHTMTACLSVALCSLPSVSHTGSGRALSVQSLWPQSWGNLRATSPAKLPLRGRAWGRAERGEKQTPSQTPSGTQTQTPEPWVLVAV